MYKRAISTQVWREVVSLSSKTCMQASNMSMEVSGNGCTCNFCINYSLALWPAHACLPLRNVSGWGLGTRLTTALFPGHPQILSHSCVVFVCFFFLPQLWDTGICLATRLASCHPSCAQLYHNVSDILPQVRAALLHNSQTSVHNNVAPVPLLSDLFSPTLNLLIQLAPGETCTKVTSKSLRLFSMQSSSHKIVVQFSAN